MGRNLGCGRLPGLHMDNTLTAQQSTVLATCHWMECLDRKGRAPEGAFVSVHCVLRTGHRCPSTVGLLCRLGRVTPAPATGLGSDGGSSNRTLLDGKRCEKEVWICGSHSAIRMRLKMKPTPGGAEPRVVPYTVSFDERTQQLFRRALQCQAPQGHKGKKWEN